MSSSLEQVPLTAGDDRALMEHQPRTRPRRFTWGVKPPTLTPATLLYTFLLVGPAVVALVLSFFYWNGVGALKWAGFGEWSRFFKDGSVWYALWLTVQVTGISWVLQTLSALAIGIATARPSRLHSVLAGLYVVPLLVSTTAVGLLWGAFLSQPSAACPTWARTYMQTFFAADWLGSPAHRPVRHNLHRGLGADALLHLAVPHSSRRISPRRSTRPPTSTGHPRAKIGARDPTPVA